MAVALSQWHTAVCVGERASAGPHTHRCTGAGLWLTNADCPEKVDA